MIDNRSNKGKITRLPFLVYLQRDYYSLPYKVISIMVIFIEILRISLFCIVQLINAGNVHNVLCILRKEEKLTGL